MQFRLPGICEPCLTAEDFLRKGWVLNHGRVIVLAVVIRTCS